MSSELENRFNCCFTVVVTLVLRNKRHRYIFISIYHVDYFRLALQSNKEVVITYFTNSKENNCNLLVCVSFKSNSHIVMTIMMMMMTMRMMMVLMVDVLVIILMIIYITAMI